MNVHPTSFGVAQDAKQVSNDFFAVKAWDQTVIAVLADGTGSGHGAREAAERTVQSLVTNYETRPRTWSPQRALTEFTRRINRTLHQDSLSRFGEPELVTTVSAAVVEGNRLYGLNVGDSRVYLARDGQLIQLSCDHVSEGKNVRHVLERAIGLAPEVEPHCFETELKDGDIAFLCSDGVYNVLDHQRLAKELRAGSAARSIIADARERMTQEMSDDLSAIVLDIKNTGKLHTNEGQALEIAERLHKGDRIDGFTLTRPFQGSDRVWLATRDGQKFTLKFPPVEASDNEELAHLFIKEVWNATRLKDARFFPAAFVPEPASSLYYAMEFIEAPSLKTLLGSRRLSADETVALGKFLLQAMQYLVGFDLVHGDLKPENILVVPGFDTVTFKLVDFGSVTDLFSPSSRSGTASYLAPERFREALVSERTELFSVGVTLFEAVTGKLPFGEIERFQTPRFHRPRRPSTLNPNLPLWLEAVILRATSTQPEKRYQHYSEMLFDLDHPEQVLPFHAEGLGLIERDPLRFYRTGFYMLLVLTIVLFVLMASRR